MYINFYYDTIPGKEGPATSTFLCSCPLQGEEDWREGQPTVMASCRREEGTHIVDLVCIGGRRRKEH
jgi:hypothetical protein